MWQLIGEIIFQFAKIGRKVRGNNFFEFAKIWIKLIKRFTLIPKDWNKIIENNFLPIPKDWNKIIENNFPAILEDWNKTKNNFPAIPKDLDKIIER
jgi:hypothetical protein